MLYIISAPSGGGKTSLVRALLERMDNLVISVSYTTRPLRTGEADGINYHYVDDKKFQDLVAQKVFLEYAQVFGSWYGTSKEWVNQQIDAGKDVILEIDWQGANQIRKHFEKSLSIFIVPPSMEILRKRLKERARESDDIIEKRMQQARSECEHFAEFDYLVINDDFEHALIQLETIILAERLSVAAQKKRHQKLLETLISV